MYFFTPFLLMFIHSLFFSSLSCMTTKTSNVSTPGFRLIEKQQPKTVVSADTTDTSDKDTSDEYYTKLHAPFLKLEQKAYEMYRQALARRQQQAKKQRPPKKYYIRCSLCEKWHIVPRKKILDTLDPASWTCFDNVWGTLEFTKEDQKNKYSCLNRPLGINIGSPKTHIRKSKKVNRSTLFVQCHTCKKWHTVPPSTGLTKEILEALDTWECADNSWAPSKAYCSRTKAGSSKK